MRSHKCPIDLIKNIVYKSSLLNNMQVKKERTHQCGLSNIDFRRLNDAPNIKKFQDDMRCTNFGLMGRNGVPYVFGSGDGNKRDNLLVKTGFTLHYIIYYVKFFYLMNNFLAF